MTIGVALLLAVSGLQVGEAVPSWQPIHVAGPDRGTQACPVCTYGARPMLQAFAKEANAAALAARIETLVARNPELKAFVTVVDSTPERVKAIARETGVVRSALCYPEPGHEDTDLRRKLKIDPAAENTVIVYKSFKVTASFVNVDPQRFAAVESAVANIVAPDVTPAALRASIRRAVPLIEKSAAAYTRERKCFSCHHQAVPIVALAAARARGFKIDPRTLRAQLEFTAHSLSVGRGEYSQAHGQGGQVMTAGYALWALEAGRWKADETTAAVTHYLAARDAQLDHWRPSNDRQPMEASDFAATFFALRALHAYQPFAKELHERTARARQWLLATAPKDTEDAVFRLRALKEAGAEDALRPASDHLLSRQRPDGGWPQTAQTESDAYATATALAALHDTGLPTTDSSYQRGVRFLVRAQLPDGSWHTPTRARPVQIYFESDFPHGKDQFISMAATSWSLLALSLASR